jgi:UDP-N-acetylglucosamine 2-epimerase (non-hydrolysing)
MKKILIIFGTRPEAIKMAPIIIELKKYQEKFETKICVTGQHQEMLFQVLNFFEITPDFNLNVMKSAQNLYSLTADIILELKNVIEKFVPDIVLVHGDTTTAMASSIAGFYGGAKVYHIEAGLRTFNKKSPFPEEVNRSIISKIADIHFAPTVSSKNNLINENIDSESIVVTGNTVIDSLLYTVEKTKNILSSEIIALRKLITPNKDIILVTGHRRENFGDGFLNICKALKEISEIPNVQIIYPVHLNPNVKEPVYRLLNNSSNILLIEPLSYESFVWLMNEAKVIITDSGGVQEEAPSLGKPVLVMRDTTERPEAIDAGTVILVGTNTQIIVDTLKRLLNDKALYDGMTKLHNPYGDGLASVRIVDYIANKQ